MKKKALYAGFILLVLAIVLYIGIRSGDFPASVEAILNMPLRYAMLSVACVFGGLLMETLSLGSALRAQGLSLPFRRLFAMCLLGAFYSYITPGASGGQPMQVYQFHKWRVPVGRATAALTIHFHCFQTMLLVFDVVLFTVYHKFVLAELGPNLPILIVGFIFNVILVSGSLMIAFYQRPVRWLVKKAGALMRRFNIGNPEKLERAADGMADGFYTGMRELASNRAEVARQVIIASVRVVCLMSVMYFIYRGLGLREHSYGKILTMGCMQYTSAAYTPLPGASGAQEGVFGLYFAGMLPDALLLSGLLAWRFVTYYMILIVGFIVTTAMGMRHTSVEEAEAEVADELSREDTIVKSRLTPPPND